MHELKSISTTILQHETQVLRLSSEDEIYMSCNWNSGDGKLDTANNYPQKRKIFRVTTVGHSTEHTSVII